MMMFQSFYIWIVVGNALPVSNFSKVLFLFSCTLRVFLYISCVLGLHPCAFNEFELLIKKKEWLKHLGRMYFLLIVENVFCE
jgi:hypothetical protein